MTEKQASENMVGTVEVAGRLSEKLKRIDAHYVSHEIQHLLHLERGFLFTVKELLLKPGKSVRTFVLEDRSKYVKPVVFLIFCAIIFTLIASFFDIKYTFFGIRKNTYLGDNIWAERLSNWQDKYFGYTNLILSIFISFWTYLIFKKWQYNIFEILVLLCYALGEAVLLFGLILPVASLLKNSIPNLVGTLIYLFYPVWAIGQFFGQKKLLNYVRASLAIVLGIITHRATLLLIAYIIKLISS